MTNDSITGNTFKIGQNASLLPDIAIQTGASVAVAAPPFLFSPNVAMAMNTFTGTNGGIGYQDGAGATGVLYE